MSKVSNMLVVLQSYAPDHEAKVLCENLVGSMRDSYDSSDESIVMMLVKVTNTGLTTGNWPWTKSHSGEMLVSNLIRKLHMLDPGYETVVTVTDSSGKYSANIERITLENGEIILHINGDIS